MTRQPPSDYMDGCTLAPNRLGRVSHRDICDEHDRAYLTDRTLLKKTLADLRWAGRIIWRHRFNWFWQPVAVALAVAGFIVLTFVGGWLWKARPRWK